MISIITPTLNAASLLPRLCESISALGCCEHVVVDGGSEDGTVPLAMSLGCRVIEAAGTGIYQAQNVGIEAAVGDWLFFAGADDVVYPALCGVVDAANHNIDVLWGLLDIEDWPAPVYANQQQSFVYRRRVFSVGGIPVTHPVYSDANFNASLRRSGLKIERVPLVLARFASGGFSRKWHG